MYGWRFGGTLPFDFGALRTYLTSRNDNKRTLLMCKEDRPLLNRACLTHHSFFFTHKEYPRQHFIEYLRSLNEPACTAIAKALEDQPQKNHK